MSSFQPTCIIECWVNTVKKDARMIFHGDNTNIQKAQSEGYKKWDQKTVLFKSIEVK